MPFYEYECTKCNNQVEIFQKISDPPVSKCDLCRGKMRKLISHSTFHLKGSGWYVTDYKTKSGGNGGKTSSVDKAAEKETKSTGTDKSSPKPEAKKSAKASE